MKRLIAICTVVLFSTGLAQAETWTTITYPGSSDTFISDIDGSNIFGDYWASGKYHAYSYDGTNWKSFDYPGAKNTFGPSISGNNFYGYYTDYANNIHSYRYDGINWETLDAPGGTFTRIKGVDGGKIVGVALYGTDAHGFIYDGTTWESFVVPGCSYTAINGIKGNKLFGACSNGAFIYDGTTFTYYEPFGAFATLTGINGDKIVGYYGHVSHGLYFDGTDWFIFDKPGAIFTTLNGFEGNKIFGYSYDETYIGRGFIYENPLPPIACIAGGNQTLEAQGSFGAKVVLDGSCSSDSDSTPGTNDDINDFNWYRLDPADSNNEIFLGSGQIIECNLPLGEHTILLEVTDKAGASDSNEITIAVQDTTPPEFKLSVTPTVLWPPNHKMVKITPTWTVEDICDPSPKVSLVGITADGAANAYDIQITSDGSIYLRAEKGRTYTLTYKAINSSGLSTTKSAVVSVPHDNGKGK